MVSTAQAGSWVQVTRWGRKATSSCQGVPHARPTDVKAGRRLQGPTLGAVLRPQCLGMGLLTSAGPVASPALSALDEPVTSL